VRVRLAFVVVLAWCAVALFACAFGPDRGFDEPSGVNAVDFLYSIAEADAVSVSAATDESVSVAEVKALRLELFGSLPGYTLGQPAYDDQSFSADDTHAVYRVSTGLHADAQSGVIPGPSVVEGDFDVTFENRSGRWIVSGVTVVE